MVLSVNYFNKVEICGVNTAKLKTLSGKEKKELLKRMQEGDAQARQELIDGNLRLVLSIVQRFSGRKENMDDLFQVGCIGLIKAVDNFNTEVGVKFSTYAVPMIIGEIRRYLRDNNMIRVSRGVRDLAYRSLSAKEEISKKCQREATLSEIASEIGEREDSVAAALEALVEPVSLYEPVFNEGGDPICVMDQIRDENCSDEEWLEDIALNESIQKLSNRERDIIRMRFFEGKTQMEIASEIGISQAQVSRLEKGAIASMKRHL